MTSKQYVVAKLSELAGLNNGYQFIIWTNSLEDDFYIETSPASFENDYAFLDLEIDLLDEFYQHHMNDSLSFITTDDLKDLKHLHEIWRSLPVTSNWVDRGDCCRTDIKSNLEPVILTTEEFNYALAA